MSAQELEVYISGERVGTLRQLRDGSRTFSYLPGYRGVPLSLSMPVDNVEYGTRVVDAYFMGLLPDDEGIRREAARRFGVSGNNPFALLANMGLDCPGAVQVCPADDRDLVGDVGETVRLSDAEIAERLAPASGRASDTWLRDRERWSLGGAQAKVALRHVDGEWFECHGGAATTHILKPGVEGMRLEALDEFLTTRLAGECGIPTEDVEYLDFCGVPAVVARRFDRRVNAGNVTRIHQEDFCQALSVMPDKKYAEDGGPSTPDVLRVLGMTTSPGDSLMVFASMLFFNYLTCSSDAHAKNYSVLHLAPGACVLAPLYDVASAFPYDLTGKRPIRMAMSIGGENRQGMVGREELARFARASGLDVDVCVGLMVRLCEQILDKSALLVDELVGSGVDGIQELADRMVPRLESHCRVTLQKIV